MEGILTLLYADIAAPPLLCYRFIADPDPPSAGR
jgi:hypothetical protein